MNERIQELAEQAGQESFNSEHTSLLRVSTEHEMYEVPAEFIEKFAELIVAECCQVLSKETIRHDGYGYNQHALYQTIREHFGVEE